MLAVALFCAASSAVLSKSPCLFPLPQALSGTGSLRVGAAFIAKFLPAGTVAYISRPTWGNHKNIFADAGVPWKEYRCAGVGACSTGCRFVQAQAGGAGAGW